MDVSEHTALVTILDTTDRFSYEALRCMVALRSKATLVNTLCLHATSVQVWKANDRCMHWITVSDENHQLSVHACRTEPTPDDIVRELNLSL